MWSGALDLQLWSSSIVICNTNNIAYNHHSDIYPLLTLLNVKHIIIHVCLLACLCTYRDSVVFHEYAERSKRRKKIHMFWENSKAHKGEGQRSLRRATSVIGMAPGIDATTWDHSELDKYVDCSILYSLFCWYLMLVPCGVVHQKALIFFHHILQS